MAIIESTHWFRILPVYHTIEFSARACANSSHKERIKKCDGQPGTRNSFSLEREWILHPVWTKIIHKQRYMTPFRKFSAAFAVLAAIIGIGGLSLANRASADTTSTPHESIIERLAAKFNLSKSDIESVFNEERKAHQAEMTAKLEERLTQAVTDGKITEEQRALILQKHEELQSERESDRENWQNMTREERQTEMQKRHDELSAWLEANNIPTDLFPGSGDRDGNSRHGGEGWRK